MGSDRNVSPPTASPDSVPPPASQTPWQQIQQWRDRWEPGRRSSSSLSPSSQPEIPRPKLLGNADLEQRVQMVTDRLRDFDQRQIQSRLKQVMPLFRRFVEAAKVEDLPKIARNLPAMDRGPIHDLWPKVQDLAKMVRDPDAAWKSRALAIGALIYLITPLDAIPDVIPGLGLVDDAALLVSVIATLAVELGQYTQKAAIKGLEMAEEMADIEVRKHNRIVRTTLLGSIGAAVLAIVVKLILNALD
ncbi:YkvA family protein [Prochlorothrix hollandica]|nr:YkvA family protein [Prochlorothrix hollandica]